MNKSDILASIKELRETSDVKEAAQLLSSGNWIAICATTREPINFSLGRITQAQFSQESK